MRTTCGRVRLRPAWVILRRGSVASALALTVLLGAETPALANLHHGYSEIFAFSANNLAATGPVAAGRPALSGAYPNPANPAVTIVFTLPGRHDVELAVYDVAGRRVRDLSPGTLEAGIHAVIWDGCDGRGRQAATGTYICRLRSQGDTSALKIAVVR